MRETTRGKPYNLEGEKFGRLFVVGIIGKKKRQNLWECVCDCGNKKNVVTNMLTSGKVRSCGCLKKEVNKKHGESTSPEYSVWRSMKQRCFNPKNPEYKNYGARGVTVCKEWFDSFDVFLSDMGYRPTPKHSLDRIDNNGNYESDNCRWATIKQQNSNKRQSVFINVFGEKLCLTEAANKYGVKPQTLKYRIFVRGDSPEKAVTVKKGERNV